MNDPALEIESRLTEDERERVVKRAMRNNPHLRGATAADLLDMWYSGDALLGLREPFHEQHGREYEGERSDLVGIAVLAAAMIEPNAMKPFVDRLLLDEEGKAVPA
jgi:hypothetical protein